MPDNMHYGDYLRLDTILGAQHPESDKQNRAAHDEMLFIIIHQAYELWFKQLLYELESVNEIMRMPSLNDNAPELQTIVHRLSRCTGILKLLVHQIDIMETMTAMDFLDFRDLLRPASGFQSWQFKKLEARLGLKYAHRYGQDYYVSQLKEEQIDIIKSAEADESLLELVNGWLERMPFFEENANWKNFKPLRPVAPATAEKSFHIFWADYKQRYEESLADAEKTNAGLFDGVFWEADAEEEGSAIRKKDRTISPKASRAALFIMLYRGYPILQLPFQLLTQLLEIDEQLSTWRYRHMHMVQRMIGTRIGTGGSAGGDYLRATVDKHYIFREIARLNSFLIERRKLPQLSPEMEKRLGFVVSVG